MPPLSFYISLTQSLRLLWTARLEKSDQAGNARPDFFMRNRSYVNARRLQHAVGFEHGYANLQRQIEEQAGGLLDERDRLIQQRLWLQNELDNVGAG